jgi:glutamine phosphoribosylpyrophosphate amidotransferase
MPYYPTVGMKKPGETLRANFGQEPFAFDIDKMLQDEKSAIQTEIARTRTANTEAADETQFIHQLIGQYLAHDGYVEAAREFSEEIIEEARALANDEDADVPYCESSQDLDALNRQSTVVRILWDTTADTE